MKCKYILLILTAIFLASCSSEEIISDYSVNKTRDKEGTVKIRFQVLQPQLKSYQGLRVDGHTSLEDVEIKTLQLWVFDENRLFIERADARNVTIQQGKTNPKTYTFEVVLHKSSLPRYIHFVGNYMLTDQVRNSWIGRDERTVVPAVRLSDPNQKPMWQRVEVPGISEATTFDQIDMKLAVCKVSFGKKYDTNLDLDNAHFDMSKERKFAMYNIKTEGTLATFQNGEFGNYITEVPGVYKSKLQESDFIDFGSSIYVFEQNNNTSHATVTPYIVFKAFVNDAGTYKYFKVDMVERIPNIAEVTSPPERHDLKRGSFLNYFIAHAWDLTGGSYTLDRVYTTVPVNNPWFNQDSRESPIVKNGENWLEVWRTLIVMPSNTAGTTATCYVHKNVGENINCYLIKKDNTALSNVTYGGGNAIFTMKQNLKGGERGSFVVKSNDDPNLTKVVTILVTRQYNKGDFHFVVERSDHQPKGAPIKQGTEFTISFTFPDDFTSDILPLTAKFYTPDLSPLPNQGIVTVNSNQYKPGFKKYYNYQMTSIPYNRTVKLKFYANNDLPGNTKVGVDAEPFGFIVYEELEL